MIGPLTLRLLVACWWDAGGRHFSEGLVFTVAAVGSVWLLAQGAW